MIKLETTFVSGDGGFSTNPLTYTQLARTDKVAIYERARNGRAFDFEVFNIKVLPKGTKVFESITEDDQERYPGSSQFGFSAWTFVSRDRAMDRYNELVKESLGETTEKKELVIPVGEFTVGELAEKNSVDYARASLFVKTGVESKVIRFVREERRQAKGKPNKIYSKA